MPPTEGEVLIIGNTINSLFQKSRKPWAAGFDTARITRFHMYEFSGRKSL
jgi:hypothetical protein